MKTSSNKYCGEEQAYVINGTAVSSATVGTATAAPSFNYSPHRIFYERLLPVHAGPMAAQKISKDEFLKMANQAYAALAPEDRDEMEIWDTTIKDGLED